MRLRYLVLAVLALFLLVSGCGDDDDDQAAQETATTESAGATGVFVGEVAGTDAYVALISDGTELRGGYVCDGKRTSVWLKPAKLSDGKVSLTSRAGDALGSAELSGDGADGELKLAGQVHTFSAAPAAGKAGLSREAKGKFGKPGYVETGWIVLADGSVRGRTNFIDPTHDLKTGTKAAPSSVGGTQLGSGFIDPTADL